jgi:hypothetical protein
MTELARLADSLVEHLAETRRHYEQLRADLDAVGPLKTLETPTTTDDELPVAEPIDEPDYDDPERVRLLALNLALSGWSQEEVRTEVEDKFPLADSDAIVKAVFPDPEPPSAPKRRFARMRGRS